MLEVFSGLIQYVYIFIFSKIALCRVGNMFKQQSKCNLTKKRKLNQQGCNTKGTGNGQIIPRIVKKDTFCNTEVAKQGGSDFWSLP